MVEPITLATRRPSPPRMQHFIREWREARGLSLGQMERFVPYTKSAMSRVENGLRPYYQEFLEAYARVIGCQPGDLINRPPGGVDELFTILPELDRDAQRAVLAVTKQLIKKRR